MATDERRQAVRRVFMDVADLTEAERDAALAEACGDDAALRSEVEALLNAEARAGGFMGDPTNGAVQDAVATVAGAPREEPGEQIGRYKLLQEIGQGGFGTVWMAEQKEPVKRRVALKIIKLGMDTKQVVARFEAERQALAMMDHPNIAKVLDAGATETGRPYFVMELVKGVPVTEYCDTENLTTDERLELFISVCNAAQHAHQKGIIHRDIKPSNVLITLHDGKPVVKVIDFGIAKAIDRELTDKTLFTEFRQFIGTPEYMSPEQAEMSGLDIDTRSDIYSLGVLLYELLTGVTPFDGTRLRSAALNEIQRIIREEEPPRPSTRLSEASQAPVDEIDERSSVQFISKHRRTDPRSLTRTLRGDLDWIVMKALEKDRARRYDTANGFAMDIQRYLDDEPVTASPPSAAYRLRKLIKRNTGAFAAAAAVFLVLTLGVVGTTSGWVSAQAEAERAERELARATEIKQLISEMLVGVEPAKAQGADTTLLAGILDGTAARLAAGEITDERIAAELHQLVGSVYRSLGLYTDAERHLTFAWEVSARVLGEENPITLASMHNLAKVYQDQSRYDESEPLLLEVVETGSRVLGEEHPGTLKFMLGLAITFHGQRRYGEAEPLMIRVLEIRRRVLGDEHGDTLWSLSNLATLYRSQRRFTEAEPLMIKTLDVRRKALGERHPDTLWSMSQLASLYLEHGQHGQAEPLFLSALELCRTVFGEDHERTLDVMNDLGLLYMKQRRYTEAEPLLSESLEIQRRVLGEEHRDTLGATTNLGNLYKSMQRYEEAIELYETNLPIKRRVLGDEDPWTMGCMTNLGDAYNALGQHEDAARMFETSLPIKRRVLGMEHPWTVIAMRGLAKAYFELGQRDDALALLRELLELRTAGADAPDADAESLNIAAWDLLSHEIVELRDPVRALGYAERACKVAEAAGGERLWMYLDTLALAQHGTGDFATAVETQKRAISLMPPGAADPEIHDRLAEYEAALTADTGATNDGQQ